MLSDMMAEDVAKRPSSELSTLNSERMRTRTGKAVQQRVAPTNDCHSRERPIGSR